MMMQNSQVDARGKRHEILCRLVQQMTAQRETTRKTIAYIELAIWQFIQLAQALGKGLQVEKERWNPCNLRGLAETCLSAWNALGVLGDMIGDLFDERPDRGLVDIRFVKHWGKEPWTVPKDALWNDVILTATVLRQVLPVNFNGTLFAGGQSCVSVDRIELLKQAIGELLQTERHSALFGDESQHQLRMRALDGVCATLAPDEILFNPVD